MEPRSAVPTFDELYEQIRALPEGKTGLILAPGELTVMSRPHARHQRASKGLLRALGSKDVVASDEEVIGLPPFDDLPFELARIWGAPAAAQP